MSRAEVEKLAQQYRTWGKWGPEDELGHANYVTEERVVSAASLVRRGTVFSMSLPMDVTGPQTGPHSRVNPQHQMLLTAHDDLGGPVRFNDDAVYMPLQSSTQWDSLAHVFHEGQGYNGRGIDTISSMSGARANSITALRDRAVGRGVLLDLPRFVGSTALEPGACIQAEDLEACAQAQGVDVGEGDWVLVRTGQLGERLGAGNWGDYAGGSAPGLAVSAADFLCQRRVAGVASDTWGLEAMPYETSDILSPLHVILLVNAGVYIGEMWNMESLADDCAEDGVYEFFLSAPPLTITGAVASPINPLAIK
ncbi:MAG: cyclase family protein [Solirubrobacteraceae bacterium]